MRWLGGLALICVAACGRISFESTSDGGSVGDDDDGGGTACRPRFVQGTCFDPGPSSLQLGEVSVGHLIIVEIEFDDTTTIVSAVEDSLGNQYAPLSVTPTRSASQSAQTWIAKVTHAGEATITPSLSALVSGYSVHAQEFANVDVIALPPFGAFSNAGTSAEGFTSAPEDSSLVVAHGVSAGLTNGPIGWNTRDGCNGNLVADIVAFEGQIDVTFPLNQNVPWIVELVAFPPQCD